MPFLKSVNRTPFILYFILFFNVKINHLLVQLFLITLQPGLPTYGFGTSTPPRVQPLPKNPLSSSRNSRTSGQSSRPASLHVCGSLCRATCCRDLESPSPPTHPTCRPACRAARVPPSGPPGVNSTSQHASHRWLQKLLAVGVLAASLGVPGGSASQLLSLPEVGLVGDPRSSLAL